MKIKSKHEFKCCDPEQVWEKLMDIKFLNSIIPGLNGLKKIGRNKYKGKLPVKKKIFKGKKVKLDVKIKVELKEINKPKSFRLIAAGMGKKSRADFQLKQSKNTTTLNYQVDTPSKVGVKINKALPKLLRKIEAQCCEENGHAH